MATITPVLPLYPDAARVYSNSPPQEQQKMVEAASNVISNYSFIYMSSNSMSNSALYERDFFEWTQTTAVLLRAGQRNDIDWHTLAEEIESMGKSERRALGSQIQRLTLHLLKWHYQPSERSNSWRSSIRNARLEIRDILEDSPSLKQQFSTLLAKHYPRARADAIDETGLQDFPQYCPWTDIDNELLNHDFWPGE